MDYSKMNRAQLIEEIKVLRERIAELEYAEADRSGRRRRCGRVRRN